MFWTSRWRYSGVPGAGPAAPAVVAVSPHVSASARLARIRLPIVCPPVEDSVPLPGRLPEADRRPLGWQDRTVAVSLIQADLVGSRVRGGEAQEPAGLGGERRQVLLAQLLQRGHHERRGVVLPI